MLKHFYHGTKRDSCHLIVAAMDTWRRVCRSAVNQASNQSLYRVQYLESQVERTAAQEADHRLAVTVHSAHSAKISQNSSRVMLPP